ncbi:sterol desaturase family protein [Spirosoma aureum]|jgi:sterol desaturase/sphingolipid hydroxylase (fatty acid hydroxylase superfamily)|uniref:Sterol desaturase family protein n=1 Tax=Spirosoma aureum TaxID=2692134 RepID=A0A6G9ASY3_9BACT|nr:sterol desaturase family protein [Spirosoma aureum]QIP15498.1 sterol desaturase family protein [Spirosoma aureum]
MPFSLFGADKIPFDSIHNLEKNIPNIIVWAVPVMLLFTAIEMAVTYYQERDFYEKKETIGSILVGLGNLVVSAALKLGLLYLCIWVYNLLPWRMELQWWTLVPCYIIYDFFSYWAHRVSHEQRFWWATHVVHHSSEHYNLTVSYRLSWIQHLKIIFFLPVAFMGFHPVIFFVTNQLAVLFQFWVHTEYIRRMPAWVEYIFATPSNHRVHHGSQEKYIDKNFGATFIFWDRIFGTFQPEEEPVIYGITTNIPNKANPFFINFHELTDMVNDVRNARGFRKKLFYIFGSPVKIAEEKKRLTEQELAEERMAA